MGSLRWISPGLFAASLACAGCLGVTDNPDYRRDGGELEGGDGTTGDGSAADDGGTTGDAGDDGGTATGGDGGGSGDGGNTTHGAEGGADACVERDWYLDEDGDELGAGEAMRGCEPPDDGNDWVLNADDPEPTCQDNDSDCMPPMAQCTGASKGSREQCAMASDGCFRWFAMDACQGELDVCDGAGECVDCTLDEHCGDSAPVCNKSERQCVECREHTDCEEGPFPGRRQCKAADNRCVECLVDDQCPANAPVCEASTCVGCAGDGDCARFAESTPVCDVEGEGECVECLPEEGAQQLCEGKTPMCAADGVRCVQCNDDGDCTSLGAAHCNDDHVCVPCEKGGGASGCEGLKRSGRPAEVCVEQPGGNVCRECGEAGDCSDGSGSNGQELCTPQNYCVPGVRAEDVELCGQCYDTRQCPEGSVCIAAEGSGGVTPEGECLPEQVSNICSTERGYLVEVAGVDVLGQTKEVCEPRLATCPEMRVYDDDCEEQQKEKLCVFDGFGWVWTIECARTSDCPTEVSCVGGTCSL